VKRFFVILVLIGAAAGAPSALASPTVRLTLIHVMQGCHMWGKADSTPLAANYALRVKVGQKVEIRVSCPMDFDLAQVAGPKVSLGPDPRWRTGTTHTLVFRKKGVYRFTATNVQSPEERGLETMGPTATPSLIVRVG
jgi:hypothetical protein